MKISKIILGCVSLLFGILSILGIYVMDEIPMGLFLMSLAMYQFSSALE